MPKVSSGALLGAAALLGCATPQSEDPLIGRWRQSEVSCPAPIQELLFHADGRYSVTWMPFETYTDYWGRWRHVPESGALALTVEGGNYIPSDADLSGRVHLEAGVLTLEEMSLGSWREQAACAAPFRR